jgi:hypothetical protein
MKKAFVRALVVNFLLQFIITRNRAGRTYEEGAAEALWLRFPFVVVANALIWALMFSTLGRIIGSLRRS